MSQFARRVYYLSAFLLFAVAAPLLLAWTSGYRWASWRSGFVETGAVVVYSNPKAALFMNNRLQGTTPIRLTHVTPGSYTLELRKSGYRTWSHALRVETQVAQVIGPVYLYTEQATKNEIPLPPTASLLALPDQSTLFALNTVGTTTTVTTAWPADSTTVFTMDFVPQSVVASQDQQFFAWQDAQQTIITSKKIPTDQWKLPPLTSLAWDLSSSSIFYAIHDGHAWRYDLITQQSIDLGAATSLDLINDQVWTTTTLDSTTTIARKKSFGQVEAQTVTTLDGQWLLLANYPQIAVLKNTATREIIQLSIDAITNQPTSVSLGAVDKLWWPDRNQSPIWLNGSDLLSFDANRVPTVIDRLSQTPSVVQWVDDGNILAIGDGQSFRIRSISSRQGRGTVFEYPIEATSTVVSIHADKKEAVIENSVAPRQLEEIHW